MDEQLTLEADPEGSPPPKEKKKPDFLKIREDVLQAVATSKLDKLEHRVAWILNHHPDARDSDVALYIRYWREFEPELLDGESIRLRNIYKLTRPGSLTRTRARLQNDCSLFLASPEVRQQRGKLSEEEREKALEAPPVFPMYTVYADESGKTNDYLVVGAVWFLSGHEILDVTRSVEALAREARITSELHFKEIRPETLEYYKAVADLVVAKGATISFTSLAVERRGHKHIDEALASMYEHVLIRGVQHQHDTGRAPLPRSLSVFKDREEVGRDKLLMARLEARLGDFSHTRLGDQLNIDRMAAPDSKGSVPIQLADLWASSVSRVLNATGARNSARDEFADYLLELVGIPGGPTEDDTVGDLVAHISL